jgi:hypothetical protein
MAWPGNSKQGGLGVVQPAGGAYNAAPMREYHYRVDREGRIFHDGTEIVDPPTLRFFLLALRHESDGRWLAICQGEQNWFEPYDTPFVIQRLGLGMAEGKLRSVELYLAGDYREQLDPATLEHDGARLFCHVRKGAFSARFGRMAMQQIAPWLSDDGSGPAIILDGQRRPLGALQPRAQTK